jgi:NADPH:quinone reductase-like Zn-dependent oxidoreductase
MKADAYFLHDSESGKDGLIRDTIELDGPREDEVLVEPLYGAWEGNMGHAVARRPIDLCRFRKEPRVVVGNAGVVRIAECGAGVTSLRPGDVALIYSGCELDRFGYPAKIWGYDAPNTMGCLATRITMSAKNLIPVPKSSKHSLLQWAAFSVRYITAWSNWAMAFGTYRLLVPKELDPAPHVWGWGGGTALGTLDLARRFGCRAIMLSGDDGRLATIRASGVEAVDRRPFGDLQFEESRFAADGDVRRRYVRAETTFLSYVRDRTDGRGVQVFVDNIGGPLMRVTSRALSREGILATCGWKEGMSISYLRSVACIARQQHVNTHYATYPEAEAAVSYAEEHGWLPPVTGQACSFDEIPSLAQAFAENRADMFPIYRVND